MIHGFCWERGGHDTRIATSARLVGWPSTPPAATLFGGMGLPSDPSVERVLSGGANTHIVHHAGKLMALQEGSNPLRWTRPI